MRNPAFWAGPQPRNSRLRTDAPTSPLRPDILMAPGKPVACDANLLRCDRSGLDREPMSRSPESPVVFAPPFPGSCLVQNSPADRVPSHGTELFATAYSIDLVPVDRTGRSAPVTMRTLLRPEPPERFPGFGLPVLAPVSGTVVAAHGWEHDHDAYRGVPSIGYALTQGRRAERGWLALAGNHVVIQTAPGVYVALAHLRQGSLTVAVDDQIEAGHPLGQCGNSGNSTEPHLHLQAMDGADPQRARPLPITFDEGLPHSGHIWRARR